MQTCEWTCHTVLQTGPTAASACAARSKLRSSCDLPER
jgi:hypothetical protein